MNENRNSRWTCLAKQYTVSMAATKIEPINKWFRVLRWIWSGGFATSWAVRPRFTYDWGWRSPSTAIVRVHFHIEIRVGNNNTEFTRFEREFYRFSCAVCRSPADTCLPSSPWQPNEIYTNRKAQWGEIGTQFSSFNDSQSIDIAPWSW